jgi:hypothetical protein
MKAQAHSFARSDKEESEGRVWGQSVDHERGRMEPEDRGPTELREVE